MIDRRLRVLRVLDQLGTVTAAAAALHLTPSAVSQQLRQLAHELDVELLEPDGRRVRLTPGAQALLGHADELAARWERARADLDRYAGSPGGTERVGRPGGAERSGGSERPGGSGRSGGRVPVGGTVRLAGFASIFASLLIPAARALASSAPGLDVRLVEVETDAVCPRLLAGDVDVAVTLPVLGGPTVDDPRFEQAALVDEPHDLLVPAGHRLAAAGDPGAQVGRSPAGVPPAGVPPAAAAGRFAAAGVSPVRLEELAREQWILPEPHSCEQYELVAMACAAAGFTPSVRHRARDWAATFALVAAGFGVCLKPRPVPVDDALAVVQLPLAEPVPRRRLLTAVRRGSADQLPIAAALDALRTVGAA